MRGQEIHKRSYQFREGAGSRPIYFLFNLILLIFILFYFILAPLGKNLFVEVDFPLTKHKHV